MMLYRSTLEVAAQINGPSVRIGRVNIDGPAYLAGEFVLLEMAYQPAQQALQAAAAFRLQQQLGAVAPGAPLHGGRHRSPCLNSRNSRSFDVFAHCFKKTLR